MNIAEKLDLAHDKVNVTVNLMDILDIYTPVHQADLTGHGGDINVLVGIVIKASALHYRKFLGRLRLNILAENIVAVNTGDCRMIYSYLVTFLDIGKFGHT